MNDHQSEFVDVSRLRIGMYVFIDLGWISHPFPLNNFKIQNQGQIDTIRALGIERIRYVPEKSDPPPDEATTPIARGSGALSSAIEALESLDGLERNETPEQSLVRQRQELLAHQRSSLKVCEKQFTETSRTYKQALELAHSQPVQAREQTETAVRGMVGKLLAEEESCIRLLSEQVGERTALHSVNVTIISLLLARACGLGESELVDIGIGAMLHDVGKIDLPARLRQRDEHFTLAEQQLYQEHVTYGIAIGKKMALSPSALLILAQHHEFTDGTGYPAHTKGERIARAARIVALVNQYDNLCNTSNPAQALTPHEALSVIFAQMKTRFDAAILGAFIRMMGVYPPGSVVQLTDDRYALVVSVNSSRPLKPRIIIHDPAIPKDAALVVDLEDIPELGIRRSLKPIQLPRNAIDYLSPRPRICYFFERARDPGMAGGDA